jgi:predicted ester cyclase
LHGTHKGSFMGIPGTGNPIAFDVIDIVTVRDGRMHDHTNVVDSLALMTGVGAENAMG